MKSNQELRLPRLQNLRLGPGNLLKVQIAVTVLGTGRTATRRKRSLANQPEGTPKAAHLERNVGNLTNMTSLAEMEVETHLTNPGTTVSTTRANMVVRKKSRSSILWFLHPLVPHQKVPRMSHCLLLQNQRPRLRPRLRLLQTPSLRRERRFPSSIFPSYLGYRVSKPGKG